MLGPFSDHLLRTFAAVPPASHVLYLQSGDDPHADLLRQLGFAVSVVEGSAETLAQINERVVARLAPELTTERSGRFASDSLLPLPGAMFDWVVASSLLADASRADQLVDVLREIRRVLKPGGWVYVVVPDEDGLDEAALATAADAAALEPAQRIQRDEQAGTGFLQAIYRRVEADTIA